VDPTPSSSASSPRGKVDVRETTYERKGDFEVKLSWPRVDLPSGAGVAISSTLEDELRKQTLDVEDALQKSHALGAQIHYRMRCVPSLVSNDVVVVGCHSLLVDGGVATGSSTYAWTIEDRKPRRISLADVVGSARYVDLSTELAAQLTKRLGSSIVVDPADLIDRGLLDRWMVGRQGLTFEFPTGAVAGVHDDLFASIEWSALRALAEDATLVDRMIAAVASPDSLFGYPTDASP
jgi:hypothetical protein